MAIKPIDGQSNIRHNVATSIKAGAIATGIQALLLPAEAKAVVRNTIFGQDAFLKNTAKCAKETMNNLGKEIDIKQVVENAKAMYPEMKQAACQIGKGLLGTFGAVALGVLTGKIITDKILNAKTNKAE